MVRLSIRFILQHKNSTNVIHETSSIQILSLLTPLKYIITISNNMFCKYLAFCKYSKLTQYIQLNSRQRVAEQIHNTQKNSEKLNKAPNCTHQTTRLRRACRFFIFRTSKYTHYIFATFQQIYRFLYLYRSSRNFISRV